LDVGSDGRIWVANTPGGRVVALGADGQLLREIPVWPGEAGQPVDVVAGASDDIFVTDASLYKLARLTVDGRRLLAWNIPVANTMDGPHLAMDGTGMIYMTEPETGEIAKLNQDGERVGAWSLHSMNGLTVKPVGIAVDLAGRIWVTDSENGNLIVIEPE
jgi:streptogramin lyase